MIAERVRYHSYPIDGVESKAATTAHAYPRHTHDQYGIGIVDHGGHSSWSGRGQVEAGPGEFICMNPGEVHDGHAVGRRPRSWRILYFDAAVFDRLHAETTERGGSTFAFRAPVFRDRALGPLFDAAFAFSGVDTTSIGAMACEAASLRLVTRLDAHGAAREMPASRATPAIRRVRERIDADPAAPTTLAELASQAGVSRYQLMRAFSREVGLAPHAYIVQRRLEVARRLIRRGRALAEVAAIAGFCDQSHLTRWFVRQLGVTPRAYAASSPSCRGCA